MENNLLNLMNLLKRIVILTKVAYRLKNKKKLFDERIKDRSSEFWKLEKRIDPDNLIYKYKKKSNRLQKLSKSDRLNPTEVLRNQNNFISDLGEIRKRNPALKLEDHISVIQNVKMFFDLGEKTINFFRDYSFFLS